MEMNRNADPPTASGHAQVPISLSRTQVMKSVLGPRFTATAGCRRGVLLCTIACLEPAMAMHVRMACFATMNKSILIVDDDEELLSTIAEFLTNTGFSVDCAGELEEAQALLEIGKRYAVVVCDLRLTNPNGSEGLQIIRDVRGHFPDMRIILLTGFAKPAIERELRLRGVDRVLHKPVRLTELSRCITTLIRDGTDHDEPTRQPSGPQRADDGSTACLTSVWRQHRAPQR